MANIVILDPQQSPPDSGDRIVIVRDTTVCMMTAWRGARVIAYPECRPLAEMLDHARKEAEAFGIATIYVRQAAVHRA